MAKRGIFVEGKETILKDVFSVRVVVFWEVGKKNGFLPENKIFPSFCQFFYQKIFFSRIHKNKGVDWQVVYFQFWTLKELVVYVDFGSENSANVMKTGDQREDHPHSHWAK